MCVRFLGDIAAAVLTMKKNEHDQRSTTREQFMYTNESFSGVGESFTVCIDAHFIRKLYHNNKRNTSARFR